MQHAELATLLVEAGNAEREALLTENTALADSRLGYLLKDICLGGWSNHPAQALGAAAALQLLCDKTSNPEIAALRAWTSGLEALIHGQMGLAIEYLEDAQARFLALDKPHVAAATQVSKLIALAMLGRYDEAIECGLAARTIFLERGDLLAAGKIENNIGNIYFRRDDYKAADRFQSAAKQRFALLEDQIQLAKVNNCLANTHALLHKFSSAEELYEEALRQAEASGLTTTLAEIEGNIGKFALLQGRYDRALDYLERARRRYSLLAMPHQSAIAEQDIADAYLELNLAPEAVEIYQRVIPKFAELGMRAEQARALAYCGRALILLGKVSETQSLLSEARSLYETEGNEVGAAMVMLTQALLHYRQGNYAQANRLSCEAEPSFSASDSWQWLLSARWLQGEAERATGDFERSRLVLEGTLREAGLKGQPQVAERCQTSLGLLAAGTGDPESAERYFRQAIAVTEELRAPLPGEEFRTAFFSDKLRPYHELVRLCLAVGRVEEALGFVENARSRALADTLRGSLRPAEARDAFESDLLRQIDVLRGELNYLYNQINRPVRGAANLNSSEKLELQHALREREARLMEISRQLQHRGSTSPDRVESFVIKGLQTRLGSDTALVEYTTIDDELLAFVVTDERVEVVRDLTMASEVAADIEQFRFQIDTLRHGSERVRKHLTLLERRAREHSRSLYDRLFRAVAPLVGDRRIVIVPHRALHYLPFQALHDGTKYLIEDFEISYAPSALVLQQCLDRPAHSFTSALLLGVADEQIPCVRDEVEAISTAFPQACCYFDEKATTGVLREMSPGVDVVHLACHAQFRSDNPLFSSLRLGDGWLTVRDASGLRLNPGLVTLSACETGMNAVASGDELVGLSRGFFSAGSPSVLLSLWTVDDEATAGLMVEFYHNLINDRSPAAALRAAQIRLSRKTPHPFFWSPFVLVGRW